MMHSRVVLWLLACIAFGFFLEAVIMFVRQRL